MTNREYEKTLAEIRDVKNIYADVLARLEKVEAELNEIKYSNK